MTVHGNIIAMHYICEKLGVEERVSQVINPSRVYIEKEDFRGDLAIRRGSYPSEKYRRYEEEDRHLIYDNKERNRGNIKLFQNNSAEDNRSVLVFGDSFMWRIVPLLSYVFRRVGFCHSPYVHYCLVNQFDPQLVISAQVERFLPRDVKDSDAPLFNTISAFEGKHGSIEEENAVCLNYALNRQSLKFREKMSIIHARKKEYEKAESLIDDAILSTVDGLVWAGRLAMRMHNYDKSIAFFRKALEMDETCVPAYAHIAEAHYRNGNIEQAVDHISVAIILRPNNASLEKSLEKYLNDSHAFD